MNNDVVDDITDRDNQDIGDISTQVLIKLLNMVDGESQAHSTFTVGLEKYPVSLTSTGIVLHMGKNNGLAKIKKVLTNKSEEVAINYENIFKLKCHYEGSETNLETKRLENEIFRNDRVYDRSGKLPVKRNGFSTPRASIPRANCLSLYYVVSTNTNVWTYKYITLRHEETDVIEKWSVFISDILSNLTSRPRRLLIFINPFGGKGQAQKIYNNKIAPLFKLAGVNCKVEVTERANHAKDLLQTIPLDNYDGVISVGGDGMFAEVFNGVIIRTSRDHGLEYNDPNVEFVRPSIRVGFIPGGSTDAISMCLHGTTDPVTAALHIIMGDRLQVIKRPQ
jgi:hypothetical protein